MDAKHRARRFVRRRRRSQRQAGLFRRGKPLPEDELWASKAAPAPEGERADPLAGARFVASQLAGNGLTREAVREHLRANFALVEVEPILDEAFRERSLDRR
jgi:hypothetical protein